MSDINQDNDNKDNGNGNGNGKNKDDAEPNINQLKADLEKAKSDYLYLLAEFDTYRRNAVKERSDLVKYGAEKFIREFLNVYDNFERALETELAEDNMESFRAGVRMIADEFKSLLSRFGVEEIKAQGEIFDPAKHEALSSEPRDDLPSGHIATVFKKAYKLHDKLIRPAQVTVSTAPPASAN
jgi:molecular chaperone GrpE